MAVKAYPGNTADPNTVADQVLKLREHFGPCAGVRCGARPRRLANQAAPPARLASGKRAAARASTAAVTPPFP